METKSIILKKDEASQKKVAEVLKAGGVVIIPTDTVYGFSGISSLGNGGVNKDEKTLPTGEGLCAGLSSCDPDSKIRAIKGRAETKPFIQLISAPEDLALYTDDEIPASLLNKWPGALTIIVHLKKSISLSKTLPTVAFRCPGDLWLRQIIKECGAPIYSTSVNRSGSPVLETIPEIKDEFLNEVDLIIDDGDKRGALPSTLVCLEGGKVKVLRQGSVRVD